MEKRKPHKKATKVDLMKPIDLTIIGTEDDPCFGKSYDGRAKECQACGDSELCLVFQGQKNHKEREAIEKKSSFKDIDPTEFKPDTHSIYKFITEELMVGKSKVLVNSASKKVITKFNLKGDMSLKEVRVLVKKIAKQAVDLKVVIINEKRYLKTK